MNTKNLGNALTVGAVKTSPCSIVEAVRQDLLDRSEVGVRKYGTTLAQNDTGHAGKLQHAYEEALDLSNYLKWAIGELDNLIVEADSILGLHRKRLQRAYDDTLSLAVRLKGMIEVEAVIVSQTVASRAAEGSSMTSGEWQEPVPGIWKHGRVTIKRIEDTFFGQTRYQVISPMVVGPFQTLDDAKKSVRHLL